MVSAFPMSLATVLVRFIDSRHLQWFCIRPNVKWAPLCTQNPWKLRQGTSRIRGSILRFLGTHDDDSCDTETDFLHKQIIMRTFLTEKSNKPQAIGTLDHQYWGWGCRRDTKIAVCEANTRHNFRSNSTIRMMRGECSSIHDWPLDKDPRWFVLDPGVLPTQPDPCTVRQISLGSEAQEINMKFKSSHRWMIMPARTLSSEQPNKPRAISNLDRP